MNPIEKLILKSLRKAYQKLFAQASQPHDPGITNPDEASKVIYDLLASGHPCMIARFGSTELATIVNYLGVSSPHHSVWRYIRGEQPQWWWNPNIMQQMQQWSGFFPPTEEHLSRFCEMMLEDAKQVDMLGSWLRDEALIVGHKDLKRCWLDFLIPFLSCSPWSRILEGKIILVVHPFAKSIQYQYSRRKLLFNDKQVLPDFDLQIIKAVQSLGGTQTDFNDWFEALDWMRKQMDSINYDIALIGCGAYGFPLAAHAKRMGKQAVHLGGALQLLFGIKGKRWENPTLNESYNIASFMNENWIRPLSEEKIENANKIEGACYW